jgi:cytoskeletal protein CcmA (bactofilin family)
LSPKSEGRILLERFFRRYQHVLEKEVCDKKQVLPIRKLPHKIPPIAYGKEMQKQLLCKREFKINGHFSGELMSQGKVIVGPKGFVKANVSLDELEVYGRIQGNISVNKLTLHRSAYIDGNISAKSLIIEDGAKVTGTIMVARCDTLALTSSAS